jgi:hypothetical protein
MAAAEAETVGLPEGSVGQLADRLRSEPDLVLPAHLERETGSDDATTPATPKVAAGRRETYLRALLLRDAGVFLERHGKLLTASELELFQPLRESSYEVSFYYRCATPLLPLLSITSLAKQSAAVTAPQ